MLLENSDKKKNEAQNSTGYPLFENEYADAPAAVPAFDEDPSIQVGMDSMKQRTEKRLAALTSPVNSELSEERFKNSYSNFMLPEDTPERRKQVYARSQAALDDAIGDLYDNDIKGKFERRRDASEKMGRDEYMRYMSVPGAVPEDAYRASLRVDNPMNVVDETIDDIDNGMLRDKVSSLASYGGYDPDAYVENLVKPVLREKMLGEYIDENTPKSSAEYIARSAMDNSLLGKISSIGVNGGDGNNNYRKIAAEGLSNYKSNRLEDFAAGVGSLLIDAPFFKGLGSAASWVTGKATATAAKRISADVISRSTNRYMNKRFADNIARRVITERLGSRILQSSSVQGLTLGGYDIANSVAEDILYNSNVSLGKAAGAFARGAVTGAAVGAVGTPLKKMSAGLTGGKKLLSSAGVLSAESAVFTAGFELDRLAHGVTVEPIDILYDFGESAATLLTMKMTHWRPQGASIKLDANGRMKREFDFSKSERDELRELDVDPDRFMRSIEHELRLPSFGGANAEYIKQNYAKLMSNSKLSASAKSKLMYIVENKVTSTPPLLFDYKTDKNGDGTWNLELLDANGGIIERKRFANAGNVKSYLMLELSNIRRNRIGYFEKELTQGLESQNFIHQAGLYAKERGVDVNGLADAMYKSARGESLEGAEQKMIDEIMHRSSYSSPGMIQELYDVRRAIEQKYGLEKGRLLAVVNERFFNCTAADNRALDDYEAYVRSEVEMLKKGTNSERAANMYDSGLSSMFFGYSNEDVRRSEVNQYMLDQARKYEGQGSTSSVPVYKGPEPKKVEESKIPGYVWSANGHYVSKDDINNYKRRADELSRKFGFELNCITDERQIAVPERNDYDAVMDYNNQLRALGWQHKGKIYINLPNIKDYGELETTIVHEAVAHGGLKKVFGYRLYDFLEEVYKRADKGVLDGIMRTKNQYYGADAYTVIEEYLAKIVEKAYPDARERSIISGFKDFIRSMLVKKNIYTNKNRKVSEKELESIMRTHCRYIMRKKGTLQHRKDVFGQFSQARENESGYYDKAVYDSEMRELVKDENYMNNTPEFILPYKTLLKYPYFTEEKKARVRKAFSMTEEEIEKQLDGYYYRFIGERGAKNLRKSRYKGFPNAAKSKELERQGYGADYIKFDQGWERGADGEWRYETAEKDMFLNDYISEVLEKNNPEMGKMYAQLKQKPYSEWNSEEKQLWNGIYSSGKPYMNNVKLNDILQDIDLYDAYPEFANVPVKIVANAPYVARFDSRNRELLLDRRFFLMPNADAYIAGTLQNMIQDYEGFGKTVSLRLARMEKNLEDDYRLAQRYMSILNQEDYVPDRNGKKNLLRSLFKSEFGITPEVFKERFPSYNDYLFYKLTGKNYSFSGNVEAENVRNRFSMSPFERRMKMASETETVPRKRQVVINGMSDLEKYFTGPLDVINRNLRKHYSDDPFVQEIHLLDDIDYSVPENIRKFYDRFDVYDDEKYKGHIPYNVQMRMREKLKNWDKDDYDSDDDKPKLLN